jgi:hypothetical protein
MSRTFVSSANRDREAPGDPDAPTVLGQAPELPFDSYRGRVAHDEPASVDGQGVERTTPPSAPPPAPADEQRFSRIELGLAAAMVALAAGLLALGHNASGAGDDRAGAITNNADQTPGPTSSAESAQPSPSPAGSHAGSPDAQQLLEEISAVDSDRLPASSCAAGDGHVTCRDPAPNIEVVVLTPYPSQEALYDAYADAVAALSADPIPENVGDCTAREYEGEFAWNLDLGHSYDISIDQQGSGGLDPADEAAGRLFCTEASDAVRLVWTQDPGMLLAAKGQRDAETIGWWRGLHLDLGCTAGQTGTGCTEDAA